MPESAAAPRTISRAGWHSKESSISSRTIVSTSGLGVEALALQTRYSRRRLEGFVGPKIGVRTERFGAFAKVRPGFAHLTDKGIRCTGEMCALALFARPEYDPEFALDIGGILEFYPTPRAVARFDLGTTAIRHRSLARLRAASARRRTSRPASGWESNSKASRFRLQPEAAALNSAHASHPGEAATLR